MSSRIPALLLMGLLACLAACKASSPASVAPSPLVTPEAPPAGAARPQAEPYRGRGRPLGDLVIRFERAVAMGSLEEAKRTIFRLRTAIMEDGALSPRQRSLEQELTGYREAKLESAWARMKGDKAQVEELRRNQIRILKSILQGFADVLEPAETEQYRYQIGKLEGEAPPEP